LRAPIQFVDPASIEQIVMVVVARMIGVIGYFVKGIREMRCTPYLGKEDTEISG